MTTAARRFSRIRHTIGRTTLLVMTASLAFAAPHATAAADPETPAWEVCGEGFECASLDVSWDHADPSSGTLTIPLVRHPATDSHERIGALLYNPGGPGMPGTGAMMALIDAFPQALQERFDIVSFDPRGTGTAAPVDCGTDVAALFASATAADPASEATSAWSDLAAACAAALGDHAASYSTAATARDIDAIREALGEEAITWLGTSYGTRLGAEYARRFPDRVRAMVLDGAMDPAAPLSQQALDMAAASEVVLERTLAACWGMDPCPLGEDPLAAYDTLAAQLEETPLTTSDGHSVGIVAMQSAALSAASLPIFFGQAFIDAMVAAQAGDGDGLLAAGPVAAQEAFDPQWVTLCSDEAQRLDPAAATALAGQLVEAAPRTGLAVAATWGLGCQGFPVPGEPIAPFDEEATAPVLVVGRTGDPSTSYAWSERMADALGAPLLTSEGDGHTAFFNTFLMGCAGAAVSDFLIDPAGAQPPTTCPD